MKIDELRQSIIRHESTEQQEQLMKRVRESYTKISKN